MFGFQEASVPSKSGSKTRGDAFSESFSVDCRALGVYPLNLEVFLLTNASLVYLIQVTMH